MKKMILFGVYYFIIHQVVAQQTFTDVTNAMGISVTGSPAYGQAAAFCDIDNDGKKDIIAIPAQLLCNRHLKYCCGAASSEFRFDRRRQWPDH